MRDAWRGPAVELVVEPSASVTAENAARTLPLLVSRGVERGARALHAAGTGTGRGSSSRGCTRSAGSRRRCWRCRGRAGCARSRTRSRRCRWRGGSCARRRPSSRGGGSPVSDTLVFIPAWNEEGNLPGVLEALQPSFLRSTCWWSTTARPTDRRGRARARRGGGVIRREPRAAGGDRGRVPLGARARVRVLRSGRRRRAAPAGGAGAAARAGAGRCVRRRSRLALRRRARATSRTGTARRRRGASGRRCCGGRWRRCWGGRSATRRAGSGR